MSTTPRIKHGAEFLDVDGDAIRISTENDPDAFSIRAGNTYREFANADAPAVALAILTAAGHLKPAGTVAEDDKMGHRRQTINGQAYSANDDPQFWVNTVAAAEERLIYTAQQLVNTTAIRDYFANGIERAEKELIRRRDELAVSLCLNTVGYDHSTPGNQRAIDMIIQLQDEAAK